MSHKWTLVREDENSLSQWVCTACKTKRVITFPNYGPPDLDYLVWGSKARNIGNTDIYESTGPYTCEEVIAHRIMES